MVKSQRVVTEAQAKRRERRAYTLGLTVGGVSIKRIARRTGVTERTVRNTIRRSKQRKGLSDSPRTGRPTKITSHVRRRVRTLLKNRAVGSKRRASAALKREGIDISTSTVQNVAKSIGLRARVRGKKYQLSSDQRKQRLAFANNHKNDSAAKIRSTIYLDEKLFICNVPNRYVYVEDGDYFDLTAPGQYGMVD